MGLCVPFFQGVLSNEILKINPLTGLTFVAALGVAFDICLLILLWLNQFPKELHKEKSENSIRGT